MLRSSVDDMEEDMEFMKFTDSVEEVQNSQKYDSEVIIAPISMGSRPRSIVNDESFRTSGYASISKPTVSIFNGMVFNGNRKNLLIF